MGSRILGAYIDVDRAPKVASPPAVLHKQPSSPFIPNGPDTIELNQLARHLSANDSPIVPDPGEQTPASIKDLEMSRPSTPQDNEGTQTVQNFFHPFMNRFRVASACLTLFGNGLNDSAPGALIPYMERDYKIGYAIVSLIFISTALGVISAAFFIDAIHGKLGRAKTLAVAQTAMVIGYIPLVFTPPFPVTVATFFLIGVGMAINLALNNNFIANLANSPSLLGAFHGSYGIGATVAPLIATSMVSHGLVWSRFYILALVLTTFNLVFAVWAFWKFEDDSPGPLLTALDRTASGRPAAEPTKMQLLRKALKNKVTILGAMFVFAYQGAEVSISGWVISFLINYRNGNPADVGYVTAGFWGGITLGRFVLVQPAHRLGEKYFVSAAVALSVVFQLLVWFVPNIIGDAVAVSILGLLLGPVYPCIVVVFTKLMDRRLQMSSMSLIYGAGSSGGAVAPFATGMGAQIVGTWVLHPVCIGLFVVMETSWFLLPRIRKRTE